MKAVLFTTILTLGLLANASKLECAANITDQNTQTSFEQAIEITATNAKDFKAEAGEVLFGDLKLAVYRNITGDSTNLSVSKKNDSSITPYLQLSSSSAYKLVAGQALSFRATVDSVKFQINCLLK